MTRRIWKQQCFNCEFNTSNRSSPYFDFPGWVPMCRAIRETRPGEKYIRTDTNPASWKTDGLGPRPISMVTMQQCPKIAKKTNEVKKDMECKQVIFKQPTSQCNGHEHDGFEVTIEPCKNPRGYNLKVTRFVQTEMGIAQQEILDEIICAECQK